MGRLSLARSAVVKLTPGWVPSNQTSPQGSFDSNLAGSAQKSFGQFGQQKPITRVPAAPVWTSAYFGFTGLPETGHVAFTGLSSAGTSSAPGSGRSLVKASSPSASSTSASGSSPLTSASVGRLRSRSKAALERPAFQ